MAHKAREQHLKTLQTKGIVTKYIQIDGMETFEKTKKQPLGIELAIRAKTGQILAAKVCRIPIKGLSVSPQVKAQYKKQTDRDQKLKELFLEIAHSIDSGQSTFACDGDYQIIHLTKVMSPESLIESNPHDYTAMWRLNHTCAKLRHHLSRLNRKTWATTKKAEFLQMHLDLFIAYQNGYEL